MSATRNALDYYKMRDIMGRLKKYKNFLHTNVWPEYGHVIEFFESKNCSMVLTDSGGVQEEMNLLGKVCLTCRFNTDRPETVNLARGNLLVPPMDSEFIVRMAEYVKKDEGLQKQMRSSQNLYGHDVGSKFIGIVDGLMQKEDHLFKWAHEALGLWKETNRDFNYL